MNNTDSTAREYQMRWSTLAVIATSVLNIVFDTTIVSIPLPTFQWELASTQTERQWIVNIYMLIFGSLMPVTGALGDPLKTARVLNTIKIFPLYKDQFPSEWYPRLVGRTAQVIADGLTCPARTEVN